MSIGSLLKDARLKKRMSQREVAVKINASERTVGLWENGRFLPSFRHQRALAEALEIDLSVFASKEAVA